jgi:hypothetical protein
VSGATPGQALVPVESVYLYHWRFDRGEEFGLYRRKADADALAEARKAEYPGEGLFEVLGMALLDWPQPRADAATPGQATRLTIGRIQLYVEPRDLWIGVYVAPAAVYVCALPMLVIRWSRA